ncbi:MAG: tetratricopeptide repeat protein [Ruminococcus sp.]
MKKLKDSLSEQKEQNPEKTKDLRQNDASLIPADLLQAAKNGDADAQFVLGFMYDKSVVGKCDDQEAIKWFRKAAEQGHAKAQYNLGKKYYSGFGVQLNNQEAVKWFRKAAEQGYAYAQYALGAMYHNGEVVQMDNQEAAKWFKKAAEQGHAQAQYQLAKKYFYGNGVQQDYEEAEKWFRKAAEQGHAQARQMMGCMYLTGDVVQQDSKEAERWFRKPAESSNFYKTKAEQWLRKSAESIVADLLRAEGKDASKTQGDANALSELGKMFEKKKQDEAAVMLYRKAAEQGDYVAVAGLSRLQREGSAGAQSYGLCLSYEEYGNEVQENYEEAAKWFRKAAEQEDAGAQYYILGYMYIWGKGVQRDYEEAAKWYRKAAEQGHAKAQCQLGEMYDYGEGVQRDYEEAAKWYRKAAEQGHEGAQHMLGNLYKDGRGVRQDYKEAARWYRKATDQGNSSSRYNLELLRKKGYGHDEILKTELVFGKRVWTYAGERDGLAKYIYVIPGYHDRVVGWSIIRFTRKEKACISKQDITVEDIYTEVPPIGEKFGDKPEFIGKKVTLEIYFTHENLKKAKKLQPAKKS